MAPARCVCGSRHPAGDDRTSPFLSIIQLSRSVAGYTYRYPFMSGYTHKGPLTRPEQLNSPYYKALRGTRGERQCRYPVLRRARVREENSTEIPSATFAVVIPDGHPLYRADVGRRSNPTDDHDQSSVGNSTTRRTTVAVDGAEKETGEKKDMDKNNAAKPYNSPPRQKLTDRVMRLFGKKEPRGRYRKRQAFNEENDDTEQPGTSVGETVQQIVNRIPQPQRHPRRTFLSRFVLRARQKMRKVFRQNR